jgi:hypothetical protein
MRGLVGAVFLAAALAGCGSDANICDGNHGTERAGCAGAVLQIDQNCLSVGGWGGQTSHNTDDVCCAMSPEEYSTFVECVNNLSGAPQEYCQAAGECLP